MRTRLSPSIARTLPLAVVALLAACAADAPLAPERSLAPGMARESSAYHATLATLRRVTARYHDVQAAEKDGFALFHPCENRPGEGPVGVLYVNFERLLDGAVDAERPDALLYAPTANGGLKLVGVELAVLDVGQAAPTFLGHAFQAEEEFGVWALHAWVWSHNPEGMFAESNPRISCGTE